MTFVAEVPNTYNPAKEYDLGFWLSRPKLNGVRCIYTRDGAARGLRSQSLTTRFVGLDRLELACRSLCDANNLSFLDGELYIPGGMLDELTLLVRDRVNYELAEKFAVEFRVSAVGSANPNLTGQEMVNLMQQNIPTQGMVSYIPQKLIRNTPIGILDEVNLITNAGLNEGIILRNPQSVYSGVRSDNLLKVKGITSGIFTVVGFSQNTITGYVGYMSVERTVDGVTKTSRVYGLNEEEEQDLWMNQNSYLGKNVLIVYMGLTATGNLRNPALGRFVA